MFAIEKDLPNKKNGPYCGDHKRERQRAPDAKRGSSTKRGYRYKWQRAAKAFLGAHPLCSACERAGRVTPAAVVDHTRPHRGDMNLF